MGTNRHIIERMKTATMHPTDELGQFIREQTPPVVLLRPFPACMHNPLRNSDADNQPSNLGDVYDDECRINPVSLTPKEFTSQHGPHPGSVVTWHPRCEPPPVRPPLTLLQRLLPWTRPKLTDAEKWARKQLD